MTQSKRKIIEQLTELNKGVVDERWATMPVHKLLIERDNLKEVESSESDDDNSTFGRAGIYKK